MKEVKMGVYTKGEETFNFNFYTDLSIAQKLLFVNSVTDLVVDENRYNSVIRDLVFDFYAIDVMTDIDTTEFKASPAFLDSVEQFLEETNIVDIVKANASPTLFDELNKAVDKAIEYRTGIHPSPIADSLASLFSTIEKKAKEFDMNDMVDMAQKFAGMTGELTPESIVDAYMNSDTHQKNAIEIEEAKKQRTEFAKDMDKAIKLVKEENKDKTESEIKTKNAKK